MWILQTFKLEKDWYCSGFTHPLYIAFNWISVAETEEPSPVFKTQD